jgi:hypothetical protein
VPCRVEYVCPYSQLACDNCDKEYIVTVYVQETIVRVYTIIQSVAQGVTSTVTVDPSETLTTPSSTITSWSSLGRYPNSTFITRSTKRTSWHQTGFSNATATGIHPRPSPSGKISQSSSSTHPTANHTTPIHLAQPSSSAPTHPASTSAAASPPTNGGGKMDPAGISLLESEEGFSSTYYYINGDKTIGE